ncbi:hypothetical protein VB005_07540 [Metarhizium brunneum]
MRFAEEAGRCLRSSRMERGTQEDAAGADRSWRRRRQGKGKGRITGQKITESKFLQFLAELDPEFIHPLVEAVPSGEITISETIEKRWEIVVDIFTTARYATPPEFWQDVARNLPDITREISEGKTPEEKLKIANKNVNEVVNVWPYTLVGVLNENIMKEAVNGAPPVHAVAVSLNKLWLYTPIGWLVNQIAPLILG